MGSTRTTSLYR